MVFVVVNGRICNFALWFFGYISPRRNTGGFYLCSIFFTLRGMNILWQELLWIARELVQRVVQGKFATEYCSGGSPQNLLTKF